MKELCVREIHYVKMSFVTCMPFLLMRKGGSTLQSPREDDDDELRTHNVQTVM